MGWFSRFKKKNKITEPKTEPKPVPLDESSLKISNLVNALPKTDVAHIKKVDLKKTTLELEENGKKEIEKKIENKKIVEDNEPWVSWRNCDICGKHVVEIGRVTRHKKCELVAQKNRDKIKISDVEYSSLMEKYQKDEWYGSSKNKATLSQLDYLDYLGYEGQKPKSSSQANYYIQQLLKKKGKK